MDGQATGASRVEVDGDQEVSDDAQRSARERRRAREEQDRRARRRSAMDIAKANYGGGLGDAVHRRTRRAIDDALSKD